MSERPTPETALECAFALLKCSPIGNPENSSEYGRAAYILSEHCQGEEDVSEAAMRIFAERIAELERERDEAREICSKLEKTMSYSSGATTLLSKFLKVLNERNGLIQKMDAWEEIAEHLHHLVQHPAYGVDQAIRRMDVLEAYKHLKNGN